MMIKKFFSWFTKPAPQALSVNQLVKEFGELKTTASGLKVGVGESLSYAPVWQAVNMISGDVSKLRLNVYKRLPELGPKARDIAKTHSAFSRIARFPNDTMSAKKFWNRCVFHYLLWNNCYVWIDKSLNGQIRGLYHLLPDRTSWDARKNKYGSEINGTMEWFDRKEILHFEGVNVPGVIEPSLLKNARESWSVGLAAQQHASKFFAGSCHPGGILEVPSGFKPEAKDNLEKGLRAKLSGDAFQTLVLGDGAKWHQIQVDAERTQMSETRIIQSREVANWFNIPPSKLGIPDSGGYGSRSEDNRNYHDQCLAPILCEISSECELKLLTESERRSDSHYIEHNYSAVGMMDRKSLAEIANIEFNMGAINANEYRAMTNRNPREGGDVYFDPNSVHTGVVRSDDEEDPADEPQESDDTIQNLITEKIKWFESSIENKFKKESERKNDSRFQSFLESFEAPDLSEVFEKAIEMGLTSKTQSETLEEIKIKFRNKK
jgi:HK97 family phage portal protein